MIFDNFLKEINVIHSITCNTDDFVAIVKKTSEEYTTLDAKFEEYLEYLEGNSRIEGEEDKQIPIGQSAYNLVHSVGWQIIENIKTERF
ncbi:11402_t:CDS:2 [Diversispora eburnea]|uniref:11402_t:CDS:1 n=1 Tax=Diversispora eburnea TaxID=1213867 RepID=A0A9N8WRL3_9GLOM|nr:11402_t:CDS:2 [Diversispora eburnea]